jgi:hypothetical protein
MIFIKSPLFRSLQSDLADAFRPTFQLKVQKRAGFMCLALPRLDGAPFRPTLQLKSAQICGFHKSQFGKMWNRAICLRVCKNATKNLRLQHWR